MALSDINLSSDGHPPAHALTLPVPAPFDLVVDPKRLPNGIFIVFIHDEICHHLLHVIQLILGTAAHRALPLFIGADVHVSNGVVAAALRNAGVQPGDYPVVVSNVLYEAPFTAYGMTTTVMPTPHLLPSQVPTPATFSPPPAILLLAGCGSRLLPRLARPGCPPPLHKSLTELAPGLRILDRLVRQLAVAVRAGTLAPLIYAVVGYNADVVEVELCEIAQKLGLTVEFVHNELWSGTNTVRSAQLGLAAAARDGHATGVVLNGDVVLSNAIFTDVSFCRPQEAVLVGRHVLLGEILTDDECVRAAVAASGRIIGLGKSIAPHPPQLRCMLERANHESIGVYIISTSADRDCAAIQPDKYFDDALSRRAGDEIITAIDISGLFFIEIDTPEDLAIAQAYIRRKGEIPAQQKQP